MTEFQRDLQQDVANHIHVNDTLLMIGLLSHLHKIFDFLLEGFSKRWFVKTNYQNASKKLVSQIFFISDANSQQLCVQAFSRQIGGLRC